jgi:predicted transcriptional regulator
MMIAERKNTRGRIEIIASILFHCREGIKKTHIMCKANVGYEQLCYYLPNLIDIRLVTQHIEDGSVVYRTTDTGREYLKFFFGIVKLLGQDSDRNLNQMMPGVDYSFGKVWSTNLNASIVPIFEETDHDNNIA